MLNFSKKYISSFILCPSKNGTERFNWFEEYTKDYIPSEVSNYINTLSKLQAKDKDFNEYGYLVVPKDIFYNQIKDMVNQIHKYYDDDEVTIYRFENKIEMFYKPFFLPSELVSSIKYFGLN